MGGIKPEAAKAQYYARSLEQAFHLSRPCRFAGRQAELGFTKKAKEAKEALQPAQLRLNFKANKYDRAPHVFKFIPNHNKNIS